ncbi:hypothetical protein [Thermaerobacter litoralis]
MTLNQRVLQRRPSAVLAEGPLTYLHARYTNGRQEWLRRYEWVDPTQLLLFDHKYGSSIRFRPREMPLDRLSLQWIEPVIARVDTATLHIVLTDEESVIRLFVQGSVVGV